MARRIPGRAEGIGKRWPHRALNVLSPKQLWKYLIWKSGGWPPEPTFSLPHALDNCRRILIILPDDLQKVLLCLPFVQTLAQARPNIQLQFVVNQDEAPFMAGIFGPERIFEIRPDEFFWGEPHLQILEKAMQSFAPDILLNLREEITPLLGYLIRISRTPVRIHLSSPGRSFTTGLPPLPGPLFNLQLEESEPANHLRRINLATSLWNFSTVPFKCKWSRLKPSPEHLQEARSRLLGKGLRPDSTRIFLWQSPDKFHQQELLRAALSERHKAGESKSLVIVAATGAPFFNSPPEQGSREGVPCFEVESIGLLLGFFAQTAGIIGLNGPVLQLAGLSDAMVEAHFEPEEAVWDSSFLNAHLKVKYRA